MADDKEEQPDTSTSPRSPVVQWLRDNSVWLGTATGVVAAITAVIALYPMFFGSQKPGIDNTIQMEGTNYGEQVAGNKFVNVGDPKDKELILSQQETTTKLISLLPARELNANEQAGEEIADAVVGLSALDSAPSQIAQAEAALVQGDTELAL